LTIYRGLSALIFLLLLPATLFSKYLHIDDVTQNEQFSEDIQRIGEDLYSNTGVHLYIVMVRELKEGVHIADFEKEIIATLEQPAILMAFSELDSQVDIIARPESLYATFNKKQVLSPTASFFQKLFMSTFYSGSLDEFIENMSIGGGSIIPLLSQKAKEGQVLGKYSGAMFNGYADIAEQVAESKGTKLSNEIGNSNKYAIYGLKVFFYGTILLAIMRYMYIRVKRKRENEK